MTEDDPRGPSLLDGLYDAWLRMQSAGDREACREEFRRLCQERVDRFVAESGHKPEHAPIVSITLPGDPDDEEPRP